MLSGLLLLLLAGDRGDSVTIGLEAYVAEKP